MQFKTQLTFKTKKSRKPNGNKGVQLVPEIPQQKKGQHGVEAEAGEGGYQLCGKTAAQTERDLGLEGGWKRPVDPLASLIAFLYISLGTLERP